MRKDQKWLGLVTHASPYSLPRGANREQVNVHCRTPGQLQSREGMQSLVQAAQGPIPEIRDAYALRGTQGSRVLSLTPSGQLQILERLTNAPPLTPVLEPDLEERSAASTTNYLWQYRVAGGETSDLVFVFYGGDAVGQFRRYRLDVSEACGSLLPVIDAGGVSVTDYTGVPAAELCDNADP